ncbi:MAG: synthase subunit [Caulobacter sp.]|jgi:F-type H+-transporting ATPase subunit b|nr:synthase subunit [Caulobacter sp.]
MDFVKELLLEAETWVGVAFVLLMLLFWRVGAFKTIGGVLDGRGVKIQAQLDEATRLREEAQTLLAGIKAQAEESEKTAAAMLENAKAEAKRLQTEAKSKLEDQISRRAALAERKIATAESQATADVKAAAADLASQVAEQVLATRIAGATSDPLIDQALKTLGNRLQ